MHRDVTTSILAAGLLLGACSSSPDPGTADAAPGDTGLTAIGAIRGNRPSDGMLVTLCTGTLIGPHTVITAAHCAQFVKGTDNLLSGKLFFALGLDAGDPDRSVRIVSDQVAPLTTGGATDRGSDVAVFQLEEDLTDVTPIAVASAPLTGAEIGTPLSLVGYGMNGRNTSVQTPLPRRAAQITPRGVSGHPWYIAFPDLTALVDEVIANEGVPAAARADLLVNWQPYWNDPSKQLIPDYELYAGLGTGDVQPCALDSGAPLLRPVATSVEIVGIHARSWTVPVNAPNGQCLLGGTYELVSPVDIQDLVASALDDVCRGVSAGGLCSSTTAIRCVDQHVTLTECTACTMTGGTATCAP
jgi:hypothetical protein